MLLNVDNMEGKMGSLEEKFVEVCGGYLRSHEGYKIRGEQGLFSFAMVVWLGVQQRLRGNSLRESVAALTELAKRGELEFLTSRVSKKLRNGMISGNNGGLCRARERYSVESVKGLFYESTERIFGSVSLKSKPGKVYVLDGQIIAIARSESNLKEFCATGNGEGELHFPRIRAISAHEVQSGVAREVAIGDWKSSEVALSKDVAKRLPSGSLLIMDRGFARPPFLKAMVEEGLDVLVRLNDSHGSKLLGEIPSCGCREKEVEWIPSQKKEGSNIKLKGRVIYHKTTIKGFRSSEFYFFTTNNSLPAEELAELYRQRVQVEIFIRDIKQTLRMMFIRSRKGDNVKKEILIAYLTFNLVRSIMADAALTLNLPVQRISFSATITLIKTYASLFATAKTNNDREKLKADFYTNIYQCKLPNRSKQRSYPRVIKFPRDKYQTAGIFKPSL